MARTSDGVLDLIVLGAVSYGAYRLGLSGTLGEAMQEAMLQITEAITGERPATQFQPCNGPFGELVPMIEANSILPEKIMTWQDAQRAANRNPYNWNEFRRWLTRNGFPDPGKQPPSVFCREPA